MPWDAHSFAHHNHSLGPSEALHASHIANAILRRSGDEGLAIATANKLVGHGIVPHRDSGGSVDPTTQIGGVAPSAQTANPLMQGMIQRYSSMPTEKLTELGAMMGGSQQGQLIQKLLMQRRVTPPQAPQQAQQQAPTTTAQPQQPVGTFKRGGTIPKRAGGGDMGVSPSQGDPWWTRAEARAGDAGTTGFLHGSTPGRADMVKTQAPAGSYVFPADVVAGLGEGNSLAGANIMQRILDSGPYGTPLPRGARGMGPPRPPAPVREAKGGKVPYAATQQTPVALSHGEFVATPEHATRWGNGDIAKGHKVFDQWVLTLRKAQIKKLKSLPGPVKS